MNTHQLPERPSLDHLRRQARDLQKSEGLKLASAQRELAKRYGFKNWADLRAHVLGQRLETAVNDALGGRTAPDLSGEEPVFRLLRGDATGIDPHKPLAPRDWPPLLYVCFSRVARPEDRRAAVADLLVRGADPNASWIHPQYPDPPQTPVAAATYIHWDADMLATLLRHGANPNDGEGIYHGTEQDGHACLRLLLDAGGSAKGWNAVAHMLDRDDPEGLQLILHHYGSPDDELHNGLHHAIIRGRDGEHVRRLLAHGADPEFRRHGLRPGTLAMLYGNASAAEALPIADPDPTEAWLIGLAERRSVPIPEGVSSAQAELALTVFASQDNDFAVRELVGAGISVDARGDGGRPAISEAGWFGAPHAVAALIELGADLALKDPHYQGTPLNWTVAGAAFGPHRDGLFEPCIRAFREANAPGDEPWLDEISRGHASVRAALGYEEATEPSAISDSE